MMRIYSMVVHGNIKNSKHQEVSWTPQEQNPAVLGKLGRLKKRNQRPTKKSFEVWIGLSHDITKPKKTYKNIVFW